MKKSSIHDLLQRAKYELPKEVRDHITMLDEAWKYCHDEARRYPLNRRKQKDAERVNDKYADYLQNAAIVFAPFASTLEIKMLKSRRTRALVKLTALMDYARDARIKAESKPRPLPQDPAKLAHELLRYADDMRMKDSWPT